MNTIRVGILGAGANTVQKHIPLLKKQTGVELISVCNRSVQSSQKVAQQFGFKRFDQNWQEMISDKSIDAILIGTHPNFHKLYTM